MTSKGMALVWSGAMAMSLAPAWSGTQTDAQLDRWVERVLATHPKAQAASSAVDGARGRESGSLAWMAPTAQWAYQSDGRMDFSVSQMVPGWGKTSGEARVRSERTRMKRLDSLEVVRSIDLAVREAAWMEWMAWRKVAILSEQDSAWQKLSHASARTLAQGMGTASETWLVRARETQGRTDLAQARAQAQAASAMRAAWTGPEVLPFVPASPEAPDWDSAGSLAAAENLPDVRSMEAEASMQEAMSKAMQTALRPDFMVGAMAMRMSDGMPGWGVMAGMTLPFAPWSSGMANAESRAALASASESRAKARSMRRMAFAEQQGHHRKAWAAWKALREGDSLLIPGLERAVADARSRYAQGKEMLPMLLSMEEMVRMARMQQVMARGEYELERVRLQSANRVGVLGIGGQP